MRTLPILCLLLVAAAPATRESPPIEGPKSLVALIPKEVWGTATPATALDAKAINDWASAITGRPFHTNGRVSDAGVNLENGLAVIQLLPGDLFLRGRRIHPDLRFEFEGGTPELRHLRAGNVVQVAGRLARVEFHIPSHDPAGEAPLRMLVVVADATLRR
jgi:hypothetical protein